MKNSSLLIIVVLAIYNFHCGNSNSTLNSQKLEKTTITTNKPEFYYSGLYYKNSEIRYINSKDSVDSLILKLPADYERVENKLSPEMGNLALWYYDSLRNRTDLYVVNLQNQKLNCLKSDFGFFGVDLVWANDSLLYCNYSTRGGKLPLEKYTAFINVNANKLVKNFTPPRGNELIGYSKDKYLIYTYSDRAGKPLNYYFVIDKNMNRLIKTIDDEDDIENLHVSPNGNKYFSVSYKITTDDKGNKVKHEDITVKNLNGASKEIISQSTYPSSQRCWSPGGNFISYLRVGSIIFNDMTKKYTNFNYLYLYNIKQKNLKSLLSAGGIENREVFYNYYFYKWSPSGKYLFAMRQEISKYDTVNKYIRWDSNTGIEKYISTNSDIENQTSPEEVSDNMTGWWDDSLLLLWDGYKFTIYNLQDDLSINLPVKGRILYLKEEK